MKNKERWGPLKPGVPVIIEGDPPDEYPIAFIPV